MAQIFASMFPSLSYFGTSCVLGNIGLDGHWQAPGTTAAGRMDSD